MNVRTLKVIHIMINAEILFFVWKKAISLTLGLVPPAKPALMVAVPQSMTMGWLSIAAAAPEEEVGALSVSLLMVLGANYGVYRRIIVIFDFLVGV